MMYAYDTLVFVLQPDRSLPALLRIIKEFLDISGYKANWLKSKALPLTAFCPKNLFHPGDFSWPSSGIKYLGILFHLSLSNLVKVNF